MNSAFCACSTACTSNATRPCCASPFRTACWRRASCAPWRISRAIQLAETGRPAGHPGGTRHRPDARHPDQRQLHPQHHNRPFRRRRAGRTRGPARLVRDHPPVVHAAPGIRLPPAQVQDRRQRRRAGPRRGRRARHRPASG
ncbi:hypothetical protein G6F57_021156 [Rhizopus arrhizus]|nr:hypothetical protein G6F57_021156 [Rhizopus arrhizus]